MLNNRERYSTQSLSLTIEGADSSFKGAFIEIVALSTIEFIFGERNFHGEEFDEAFFAAFVIVILDGVHDTVPNHVGDVHANALTHQSVTTLFVDYRTLFVHHVVVFEEVFTRTEAVFFDFLLGALDALADHLGFDHLAILKSEAVHHSCDAL